MNDLIVIMGATSVHGTMELYHSQLKAAGIEFHVEPLNPSDVGGSGGNLAYKVGLLRKFATQFHNYERIVMTDAFDVTFYGTKEAAIRKIPLDHVLWAAEKNCYPDPSIAADIQGKTPWKFANGGCLCGSPDAILDWCARAELHPLYTPTNLDQFFYNRLLLEQDPLMVIDSTTKMFFCLFGGYPELGFDNGLPINIACCTWPSFLHANGKWDQSEMNFKYQRSLPR